MKIKDLLLGIRTQHINLLNADIGSRIRSLTPARSLLNTQMPRNKRQKRDLHALSQEVMVLCNPRDKEAAHRAETEGIATDDSAVVTCRKCLSLLYKLNKDRKDRHFGINYYHPNNREA